MSLQKWRKKIKNAEKKQSQGDEKNFIFFKIKAQTQKQKLAKRAKAD